MTISQGRVTLGKSPFVDALAGPVTIAASGNAKRITLEQSHQINDASTIDSTASAGMFVFVLNGFSETISALAIRTGHLVDTGDPRDWKMLRRLLSTYSLATTRLPLEDGRVLHIRKATIPDAEQAHVYRKLGIDWKAEFPPQKRFVKS